MTTVQTKRVLCGRCSRPQNACICGWIVPISNSVEVLILQHPSEVDQAKGSARLLQLCLKHVRLVVGEEFPAADLRSLLFAPFDAVRSDEARGAPRPVLLYPDTPGEAPTEAFETGDARQSTSDGSVLRRLVVLDATWRKSRKMVRLNPLLLQLPRLSLQAVPPSRYLVRKAHRPEQLSTLEATCRALMQLEQDDAKFQPLLAAFDGFVAQQLAYRPQ